MRIEVPPKVFDALQSFRNRKGSQALISTEEVVDDFTKQGLLDEAEWVSLNPEWVARGAVAGFIPEGAVSQPETILESENPD